MAAIIKNGDTENCLRELLAEEGYKLKDATGLARLGPDIKAVRDKETYYIEIIETVQPGLEATRDFYESFFQSVSRLNNKDCKHCVIAMPESIRKSLAIRAKIYRVAWKRIAKVFPELEIWMVDAAGRKFQVTSWIYWLEQKK